MHIKEAERTLGSSFTWICDDMDNTIKEAFGNRPNSEFVIDPHGKIVAARQWSDPEALRGDLAKLLGPVEIPTSIRNLDMKTAAPPKEAPRGIVDRVERPAGASAVLVEPKMVDDGDPFYVKLRGEADSKLMRNGNGQLYLGFHLDPLYHVHWNNLVEPIRVEIETSGGVEVSRTEFRGPKVDAPTDIDPREFLIDVRNARSDATLKITAYYFACNDEEGWCKPVTQEYTLAFEVDPHGGRAMNSDRGGRAGGRGPGGGRDPERMRRMFERMDVDGDGKLSREDLPTRMRERFDDLDADGDGFVTLEEMTEMRSRGRG